MLPNSSPNKHTIKKWFLILHILNIKNHFLHAENVFIDCARCVTTWMDAFDVHLEHTKDALHAHTHTHIHTNTQLQSYGKRIRSFERHIRLTVIFQFNKSYWRDYTSFTLFSSCISSKFVISNHIYISENRYTNNKIVIWKPAENITLNNQNRNE